MTVPPADEERLRIAGRLINEKLKVFKETFGIDDKQDLLAMVAFDSMVERLKSENSSTELNDTIESKITQLDLLLGASLK